MSPNGAAPPSPSPPASAGESDSDLSRILEHAAHLLPAQAPLEVFVHHNTLHAFEHLPFHEAVAAASAALGVEGYLAEETYRAAYKAGRIDESDLDAALADWALRDLPSLPEALPEARELAKLMLVEDIGAETPAGLTWRLGEHGAATRFAPTVSPVARDRIRYETTAWLRREVERRPLESSLALLVGADATEDARRALFAERFGSRATGKALRALLDRVSESVAVAALWEACRDISRATAPSGFPMSPPGDLPRDAILAVSADDPNDLVDPLLILLAGAFLDRGQTHWSMPDREAGFFVAFRRILGAGHAVRPPWLATLGKRLRAFEADGVSAETAALATMTEMGIAEHERARFVERTLLQLPGWAGMFHRLESAPPAIGRSPASVRLVDFLAVRLVLDALALADVGKRLGHRGPLARLRTFCRSRPRVVVEEPHGDHDRAWPLFMLAQHAGIAAPALRRLGSENAAKLFELLGRFDRRAHRLVWHEAYERNYREQLLRAVHVRQHEPYAPPKPRFQVLLCIDDRMESLRRHFEEISPEHATYGVAGFFNLAIAYQGLDDPSTFPLCPVVVSPRHRVDEEPVSEHAELANARRRRRRSLVRVTDRFQRASRSLLWGSIVTAVAGFVAALPLLATVFFPRVAGRLRARLARWFLPAPKTRLAATREEGTESGELYTGFTVIEEAERVATLLESVGLVRDFARLVVLVGHDSSSVNNPHLAAYSCGACGGRSGGPNARLFAHIANRADVRRVLRSRGIDVPDTTRFVGGEYDTAADVVELYDVDEVPGEFVPELERIEAAFRTACERNAHERCRRFLSAPREATPSAARRHVEERTFDLAQARPELGHATNAACIVGRRSLSHGLFLDRRAFLVSYDPTADPDGVILERSLLAAGPVCAGINLEYFFSTTDNERLGAGTKLPHNVTALVGVMNGASSDLRTGLPRQMIEIHEPVRLQLLVETTPEMMTRILARAPSLRQLCEGEWVRLSVVHPETGDASTFDPSRGFVPWQPRQARLAHVGRSADWYRGFRGFLAPALVEPHEAATSDAREELSGGV